MKFFYKRYLYSFLFLLIIISGIDYVTIQIQNAQINQYTSQIKGKLAEVPTDLPHNQQILARLQILNTLAAQYDSEINADKITSPAFFTSSNHQALYKLTAVSNISSTYLPSLLYSNSGSNITSTAGVPKPTLTLTQAVASIQATLSDSESKQQKFQIVMTSEINTLSSKINDLKSNQGIFAQSWLIFLASFICAGLYAIFNPTFKALGEKLRVRLFRKKPKISQP